MELKEKYKQLVEQLKESRKTEDQKLRNEDIAEVLGYNRTYFSSLLGKKGNVTEDHIKDLLLHFPELSGNQTRPIKSYRQQRLEQKLNGTAAPQLGISTEGNPPADGVPVYDVPIDASFIERFRDEQYQPIYWVNIPKLRNCNFGAIVSGNSMYPVMKSGSIAMCRVVDNLDYFDPGEMYFLSTKNGFETVKYVQPSDNPEELILIPHNDKIKPTAIKKSMVLKMCIVEAWISFR